MNDQNSSPFEQRFRHVVAKMRATQVMSVLGWALLAFAVAIVATASMDYVLETNWPLRAAIFLIAMLAAGASAITLVARALRRWNRSATAAQVERRFEDLGQSVRTSVQLSRQDPANAGVSASLLGALEHDVQQKTAELRLVDAVSAAPLKLAVALLAVLALVVSGLSLTSWDWRMAIARALLGDQPYTTVSVAQRDTRIDEKETFTLNTEIRGRTGRQVKLRTRRLDSETWDARSLTQQNETGADARLVSYEVRIPKVRQPFDYQVVAGKYSSPIYRVDVRYPLSIASFDIELTPPDYTGLGAKTIDRGSFDAVQGSSVNFGIALDNPPEKAWLEFRPVATPVGEEPKIEKVALQIDGARLSTELTLNDDRLYQVFAEAADGTKLGPNRFRIRVHEDRAPKLAFEKPDQLIEVHPLAELAMRLKIADDFGLRRAGIVLQLNNEPEITLESFEYEDLVTASGDLRPRTKALIESRLPLEYFEMTVKDSISYYAFAEDNRPGQANLNETDLQFIDVRPFRRMFAVPEDGRGIRGLGRDNDSNQRNLPALDEMIDRERFVLNRTMQMKRRNERGKSIDSRSLDNLIAVQNETSEFAGQLGDEATFIEQQNGIAEDGRISDLMYAAQDAMLASVDSLANMDFDVARLQELDALQRLLDARQRLDEATSRGGGGGFASFNRFSRRMMQRIRGPRTNRERVREIVRRLKQAAAKQQFLMEKITDLATPRLLELEDDESSEEEPGENETSEDEIDSEVDDARSALDEMRRELEDEQAELSDDVQDILDLIEELNQISPLAQQRAQRMELNVDAVVGALERDEWTAALSAAGSSAEAFRILAENIAGVAAEETTDRIKIARDLGMLLTDELKQLESEIAAAKTEVESAGMEDPDLEQRETELAAPLARSAAEEAEIAKTVADILASIVDSEQGIADPEDRLVTRLQETMQENELEEANARLQASPGLISSLAWSDAQIQIGDLAERYDIVSQRLDALHREILAPRIEQLRILEGRAVETMSQVTSLQSEDQISRWHLRADGLLQDVVSAEVAEAEAAQMRNAMESAGWGAGDEDDWNWETNSAGTALAPPSDYEPSLAAIVDEIQRYIRELSMVDLDIAHTGAVPPKYKLFVERYFEVLSGANPDASPTESNNGDE